MAKSRYDAFHKILIWSCVAKRQREKRSQRLKLIDAQEELAREYRIDISVERIRVIYFEVEKQDPFPRKKEGRPLGSLNLDAVRDWIIYKLIYVAWKKTGSLRQARRWVLENEPEYSMGLSDGALKAIFYKVRTHKNWAKVVADDPPTQI